MEKIIFAIYDKWKLKKENYQLGVYHIWTLGVLLILHFYVIPLGLALLVPSNLAFFLGVGSFFLIIPVEKFTLPFVPFKPIKHKKILLALMYIFVITAAIIQLVKGEWLIIVFLVILLFISKRFDKSL